MLEKKFLIFTDFFYLPQRHLHCLKVLTLTTTFLLLHSLPNALSLVSSFLLVSLAVLIHVLLIHDIMVAHKLNHVMTDIRFKRLNGFNSGQLRFRTVRAKKILLRESSRQSMKRLLICTKARQIFGKMNFLYNLVQTLILVHKTSVLQLVISLGYSNFK